MAIRAPKGSSHVAEDRKKSSSAEAETIDFRGALRGRASEVERKAEENQRRLEGRFGKIVDKEEKLDKFEELFPQKILLAETPAELFETASSLLKIDPSQWERVAREVHAKLGMLLNLPNNAESAQSQERTTEVKLKMIAKLTALVELGEIPRFSTGKGRSAENPDKWIEKNIKPHLTDEEIPYLFEMSWYRHFDLRLYKVLRNRRHLGKTSGSEITLAQASSYLSKSEVNLAKKFSRT